MIGQLSIWFGWLSIPSRRGFMPLLRHGLESHCTRHTLVLSPIRSIFGHQFMSYQSAMNRQPQMKRTTFLNILAVTLYFAFNPLAFAQTSSGSVLYAPNINLSTGPQNAFAGTVGGIFLTTYSFYPQVNWLGYYDQNGDGLANSHVVTLWDNSTQSILASATVPAGTAAPLINGYRWVQLPSTIQLNYGSYYVIGAQTDGVDLWGDFISNNPPDNGSNGQITWNSQYVQLGSGWE